MYRLLASLFTFALTAPVAAQETAGAGEAPPLPRALFITQMDAEFARLDGDGNGTVTADEIVASQRAAVRAQALQQNQAIFAQLDQDGDGRLTANEFAQLVSVDAISVDPAPLLTQFDTDKSGTITLIEHRTGTQANFDQIDTDRDGVVTSIEMRAAGILR